MITISDDCYQQIFPDLWTRQGNLAGFSKCNCFDRNQVQNQKVYFHHVMLYCFQHSFTVSQTLNEMSSVYGDASPDSLKVVLKIRKRFQRETKFNLANFRLIEIDQMLLKGMLARRPNLNDIDNTDIIQN